MFARKAANTSGTAATVSNAFRSAPPAPIRQTRSATPAPLDAVSSLPRSRAAHNFGNIAVFPSAGAAEIDIASAGIAGAAATLPHRETIQRAFGAHDIGTIRAHRAVAATDACRDLGAQAYAIGEDVALARPTLFNAAHEAAHVVQQRAAGPVDHHAAGPTGSDAHERHADAVAEAVVTGRSAQHLLDAAPKGGPVVQRRDADADTVTANPETPAEAQQRKDTTNDLNAMIHAGQQARNPKANPTQVMINAASIVYRILRVFYPDVTKRWWISSVGMTPPVHGIQLKRSGKRDVDIVVGRDFVAQTDEAHLQDRVADVGRAFAALDANPTKDAGAGVVDAATLDLPRAIEEGGALFAKKAQFGLTAGSQAGPDDGDGYDARYWKEDGRSIVSTIEPWLAMSLLTQYLGEPVPMKDGRMTHWHFDCFEGMDVVRKYAEWRTTTREKFNQQNAPLRIGFMAYIRAGARDLDQPIKADRPGGAPYKEGPLVATTKGGQMEFEAQKIPAGRSMDEVLENAPPGSWVSFTNLDVTAKLRQYDKNKAAGRKISDAEQELIDRITPWNNENCLKIGHDRYSAFPFGIVGAEQIKQGMAEAVFGNKPTPNGYIKRNIYVSTIAYKKP